MDRLRKIIIEHKLAIVLAIIATIIVVFPQTFFRADHITDGIYKGIELIPDSPWSPRVREAQDGYLNFGSMYYKDGKDDPYLFQPLGSIIVAFMGDLLSLDINNTMLLSRLVLTPLVFLLMYYLVYQLSRDKLASAATATMLILAESVLSYLGAYAVLSGFAPIDFIRFSRPVNPAMVYIITYGFLAAFWLYYRRHSITLGVVSAVLLGLNFYNYFYSWTYLYAFGGLLVLIYLIQKNWKEAVRLGSVFVGGVIVGIPYIWNLYSATLYDTYEATAARFGVVFSHMPEFIGFTVLGSLIFMLWFPRADKEKFYYVLALALTPIITLNQQILTGRLLQEGHYHWHFHKPVAYIIALTVIFHLLSKWKLETYKKLLAAVIILASIGVSSFIQVYSYYKGDNDGGAVAIERQKYGPAMDWFNENAEPDQVVLANNEGSHITVIYTPLNVFYHRAAFYSLSATEDRLHDILFTFYRLQGIDETNASEIFHTEERKFISHNIHGMYYRDLLGSYVAIPDEKIDAVVERYLETLPTPANEWIETQLAQYEVDYLMWDKELDPTWELEKYPFLEEAATFGQMAIYRYKGGEETKN